MYNLTISQLWISMLTCVLFIYIYIYILKNPNHSRKFWKINLGTTKIMDASFSKTHSRTQIPSLVRIPSLNSFINWLIMLFSLLFFYEVMIYKYIYSSDLMGWDGWLMMMAAMVMADWITLLETLTHSRNYSHWNSHFSPKLSLTSHSFSHWNSFHSLTHSQMMMMTLILSYVYQTCSAKWSYVFVVCFLSFPFLLMWQLTCSHWSLHTIVNWYEQIREVCFKYCLLS